MTGRRTLAAQRSPDDIRARGWLVAAHFDFPCAGVMLTRWIFRNPATGEFVQGEGCCDRQALNRVREAIKSR